MGDACVDSWGVPFSGLRGHRSYELCERGQATTPTVKSRPPRPRVRGGRGFGARVIGVRQPSAAKTFAACPSGLTPYMAAAIRPSGSITNVDRMIPMYFFPA
jgi:hypothetical protein